jgi:hypothetical protein
MRTTSAEQNLKLHRETQTSLKRRRNELPYKEEAAGDIATYIEESKTTESDHQLRWENFKVRPTALYMLWLTFIIVEVCSISTRLVSTWIQPIPEPRLDRSLNERFMLTRMENCHWPSTRNFLAASSDSNASQVPTYQSLSGLCLSLNRDGSESRRMCGWKNEICR